MKSCGRSSDDGELGGECGGDLTFPSVTCVNVRKVLVSSSSLPHSHLMVFISSCFIRFRASSQSLVPESFSSALHQCINFSISAKHKDFTVFSFTHSFLMHKLSLTHSGSSSFSSSSSLSRLFLPSLLLNPLMTQS